MPTEVFIIKSLLLQDTLMLGALGITLLFLIRSIRKKHRKQMVVFSVWSCLVVGFFNSPLFGFSEVLVTPQGLEISYGLLSLRNRVLPLHSDWRVQMHRAGLRKTKRLYSLVIAGQRSMRVRGAGGVTLLNTIGQSIDRMRAADPVSRHFQNGLLSTHPAMRRGMTGSACDFNRGRDS